MVKSRLVPLSCFALLLFLAHASAAAPPLPTDEQLGKKELSVSELEDGQRHHKRGVELFKNGVYDAALIEFRRAYEIAPSFKILYNIGQVSRQLDDYASAVEAYQRYLREGKGNVPTARETEVKAELEKLSQWVGKLEISSSAPEASIAVDDIVVARGSLANVLVNSGRRKVTATLPGHAPLTRIIDVAGSDTAKLSFDFAREEPRVANEAPSAPKREVRLPNKPKEQNASRPMQRSPATNSASPAESRAHLWWWGGSAVLAAGAVTTGAFALRSARAIEDLKNGPAASASTYDQQHERMTRLALAADVLAGLAVATGSVALYLTLTGTGNEQNVGLSISPTRAVLFHTF